jgi:HlyD family secretion protein
MPATFTVDAFPDDRFAGIVQTVRNASQVTQNVVTYDAVVDVDNSSSRLRPGMTATVTFVVAEKSRALAVPLSALRFQPRRRQSEKSSAAPGPVVRGGAPAGNRRTIYVLDPESGSKRPSPVEVELGISDGTFVEILSGKLEAGDAVVLDELSPSARGRQDREGRKGRDQEDREDKPRRLPRAL